MHTDAGQKPKMASTLSPSEACPDSSDGGVPSASATSPLAATLTPAGRLRPPGRIPEGGLRPPGQRRNLSGLAAVPTSWVEQVVSARQIDAGWIDGGVEGRELVKVISPEPIHQRPVRMY